MKTVLNIVLLTALLSLAACDRKTGPYAGTRVEKVSGDTPQYTVEPKINQPTK